MKLIIDIDDEMVCNDIKNKALEPTSETDKVIINALYNGTLVSTDSDLISRSDLKEALKENEWITDTDGGGLEDIIDTAPTVCGNNPKWCENCVSKGKCASTRPQAKWKEYKLRNDIVVEYAFKCSNCKKDSGLVYRTDFCPNCGARMQK